MNDPHPNFVIAEMARTTGRVLVSGEAGRVHARARKLGIGIDDVAGILSIVDEVAQTRIVDARDRTARDVIVRILAERGNPWGISIDKVHWMLERRLTVNEGEMRLVFRNRVPRNVLAVACRGDEIGMESTVTDAVVRYVTIADRIVSTLSDHWKEYLRHAREATRIASDEGDSFARSLMKKSHVVTVESCIDTIRKHLLKAATDAANQQHKALLRRELAVHLAFDDIATIHRTAPLAPRRIIAHLGPTNSGKTHQGMVSLTQARTGIYLAPLRLMALEGRDRLASAGLRVDMMTGEDVSTVPDATHLSCTIEMLGMDRAWDVALIDEIQLLADPHRGWAWTRALTAVDAGIVIVTGSADALPMIERIVEATGDALEVIHHERRAPLQVLRHSVGPDGVRPGDAIIAFTRRDVLELKDMLSQHHDVAAIYGSLGPEVRNSEAARFQRGDAQVLVATDAIGMGLNLPIRRVLFSTLSKYDGVETRSLTDSEIRQIGGRAGRMGDMDSGWVGQFLRKAAPYGGTRIATALAAAPAPMTDTRPYVWPTFRRLESAMQTYGYDTLRSLLRAIGPALSDNPEIRCEIDEDAFAIITLAEKEGLGPAEQYGYVGCPVTLGRGRAWERMSDWMEAHARKARVSAPRAHFAGEEGAGTEKDLTDAENAVVLSGAYLWLSRKWPEVYDDPMTAERTRREANGVIEGILRQRRLHRAREKRRG